MELTQNQLNVVSLPLSEKIFLSGPAGCGKTTLACERLKFMVSRGIPAHSILILTPQRTMLTPYELALKDPIIGTGSQATLVTISGLARRMVELFWPLVAEKAGFSHPNLPPTFLTLETAQYHMARIVRPLLEEGLFSSVVIDRNRLYSQILDNLNKSASIVFPFSEIGERLISAWVGDPSQKRVFQDAQECASRFRAACLKKNLLDFSLLLQIFNQIIWKNSECRSYLSRKYQHLIYDNTEEDVPVAHDIVMEWLTNFDSALIVFDKGGGFRRFLGADPDSAMRLELACSTRVEMDHSFVTTSEMVTLEKQFITALSTENHRQMSQYTRDLEILRFPGSDTPARFFPQMLDWIATEIHKLIHEEGFAPSEIAVLSPYFSDSLLFSLGHRLDERNISWRSHRPSRSLLDDPACRAMLTIAELTHPQWNIKPARYELMAMLLSVIEGLDLVRAHLLSEITYRQKDAILTSFSAIQPDMQERITFIIGERFEIIREWILAYREKNEPIHLDHFLRRLFGEVLSQKGFGFHRNADSAVSASNLIESVRKFRQVMENLIVDDSDNFQGQADDRFDIGKEYIQLFNDGIIAAQYLNAWEPEQFDSVLLAPAHTFLMMNQPVSVQFWVDIGSSGWWERLFQPLTHPYVLSRKWEASRLWTDSDEMAANQHSLITLIQGLLRRCRRYIYLGISDLGEAGYEQRGPLLKSLWKIQLENKRSHEAE